MRRMVAAGWMLAAAWAQAQNGQGAGAAAAPAAPAPAAVQAPAAGGTASSGAARGNQRKQGRPGVSVLIDAEAIIAAQQAADRAENAPPPPPPRKAGKPRPGVHLSTEQPLPTSTDHH